MFELDLEFFNYEYHLKRNGIAMHTCGKYVFYMAALFSNDDNKTQIHNVY